MSFLVGIVFGIVIGGPLAFLLADAWEISLTAVVWILLVAIIIFSITMAGIWLLRQQIISFLFGKARGSIEEVTSAVSESLAAYERDDRAEASRQIARALSEGAVWYGVTSWRRWTIQLLSAAAVAFGATIGTVLLFRQNIILSEQNRKLDAQTHLAEAQRRSSSIFELTNIMEAIATEREGWKNRSESEKEEAWSRALDIANHIPKIVECPPTFKAMYTRSGNPISAACRSGFPLSEFTMSRIIGLTAVLKPYRYLNTVDDSSEKTDRDAELADRPLSPERGQLLLAVIGSGAWLPPILWRADFSSSDLRGAYIANVRLYAAVLENADFRRSILIGVSFEGGSLKSARFDNAGLQHVSFVNVADMQNTSFRSAKLNQSMINAKSLSSLDLTNTVIINSRVCQRETSQNAVKGDGIKIEGVVSCNGDAEEARKMFVGLGIKNVAVIPCDTPCVAAQMSVQSTVRSLKVN